LETKEWVTIELIKLLCYESSVFHEETSVCRLREETRNSVGRTS
jgi:hypothetical protein